MKSSFISFNPSNLKLLQSAEIGRCLPSMTNFTGALLSQGNRAAMRRVFFPDPMPLRLLSASGFDWIGPILPRFRDIRADVRGKPVGHFNF